ncbi:MAG TPA: hypothetical protein VII66_03260 [Gemmatimonadaceae bacterium]
MRARIAQLASGESLDIEPNAYVKKHGRDYSFNDRANRDRNRWGDLSQIMADVTYYKVHGHLPPPVGGRW